MNKDEKNISLGRGVMDLVPASQARDIFCEFGELALDATMEEGVMRDIPVLGTFVRAGSAVLAVRDKIFLMKVSKFLTALDSISDKERIEFINNLETEKAKKKIGERIIFLLESQASEVKAALIGEVFSLYVVGKINLSEFENLCHTITLCQMDHLKYLTLVSRGGLFPKKFPHSLGSTFVALGVAELILDTYMATKSGLFKTNKSYKITNDGALLMIVYNNFREKEKG